MKYSDRIIKTVQLLISGHCLADIGCDHGYMSILAVKEGLFEKVYACDVNIGPLSKAMENIISAGESDRIHTVLSDGFTNIPEDTDTAVICGMGGLLIKKILSSANIDRRKLNQLVLGPHSEVEELRSYILTDTAYDIFRETAVFEGGKHYILMDVRPKADTCSSIYYKTDADRRFGVVRNQTDIGSYFEHLDYLINKTQNALILCEQGSHARSGERAEKLRSELNALTEHTKTMKETI